MKVIHFGAFLHFQYDYMAEDVLEVYRPLCRASGDHYKFANTVEETTCRRCLKILSPPKEA